MFSKPRSIAHRPHVFLSALALMLLGSSACGHKGPPVPPPLRNPAPVKDLVVVQRGEEFVLSFTHPQTTVSGTPLEPLQIVEFWQLDRSVPAWVAPTATVPAEDTTDIGDDADSETETSSDQTSDEPRPAAFEGIAGSGDDSSFPDGGGEAAEEPEEDDTGGSETEPIEEPEALPKPTDEKLLTIDGREFSVTATVRSTVVGAGISAATYGDQIIMTLPIEPLAHSSSPPATAGEESDAEPEPLELVHGSLFAVKTGISEKLMSNFSNVFIVGRREAPASPETFSVEPGPQGITLEWPAGEDEILGFNVYRRLAESPIYSSPLAFVPFEDPRAADEEDEDEPEAPGLDEPVVIEVEEPDLRDYTDRSAVFGQRYIYALTAVSNKAPTVESAITVEREVDYEDRFAPTPPQGLIALTDSGRIRLLWNASPQDDVAGYSLSRSERGGAFVQLHDEPITALEYSDRDVRSSVTYAYQVVAIDESGNVSEPSQPVTVRAP